MVSRLIVAPFDGAAQVVYLAQAAALRIAQQVEVLLGGIGFEIGVVHAVGQGRVFECAFTTGFSNGGQRSDRGFGGREEARADSLPQPDG